jgi:hypothetical protein
MSDLELRQKLAAETGSIPWRDLERHFARGALVVVAPELDLVEVAVRVARDDTAAVSAWLSQGRLARATEEHARVLGVPGRSLRAVVVAPWVLVKMV